MNNWKEAPHLFSNGKFLCGLSGFINLRIEMYDGLTNMYCLSDVHGWHKVNDCTLIARKIENMTDEEIISFFDAWNYRDDVDIPQLRKDIMFLIEDGISFERALNLLSIGVYPFSQSHFGETVIDINTL